MSLATTMSRAKSNKTLSDASAQRAAELVRKTNEAGGSYHCLDLGRGLVIRGHYDMNKYVHHYGIPDDLKGMSVLDVGTSSRYFAFECARRGAKVTAIDIWPPDDRLDEVAELMGLEVRYVQKSIYDLEPSFGEFDLVICGSLLLHLRDIFGAIESLRRVCRGQAIIATSELTDSKCDHRPICEFLGDKATDAPDVYHVFWNVNARGLRQMFLAAGFARTFEPARYVLATEAGAPHHRVPHIVMKAAV